MKRIKHIICLLAVALAGSGSLNALSLQMKAAKRS